MRKLQTTLLLLVLAATIPAFARQRAVAIPTGLVPYTSTVVDATTGKPVIGAEVSFMANKTMTDANGSFTIPVNSGSPSTITIKRSGYDPLTVTLQPGVPPSPIKMQAHGTITVKMKSGQTVQVDAEGAEFYFTIPLLTSMHSTVAALCNNGTQIEVAITDFARMSNVVRASGAACCHIETLWFDLQQKNGQTAHVAVSSDCLTYDTFIGGHDHTSYQVTYLKLEDIAEATFP